jgi:hypothetical protein
LAFAIANDRYASLGDLRLFFPNPLAAPALEHLDKLPRVRIHYRANVFELLIANSTLLGRGTLGLANLLSLKQLHRTVPGKWSCSAMVGQIIAFPGRSGKASPSTKSG